MIRFKSGSIILDRGNFKARPDPVFINYLNPMKKFIGIIFFLAVVFPVYTEMTSVPGVVVGDKVNMRVSPSLKSEVVGQLDKGQEVKILLTDGEWCAIVPPNNIYAWVSAQYIKDGLVTGRRVNVRSGPGISYGRLTYLREGDEIKVLEEKEGWVKFLLPDSGRLWVNSRYIDQSSSLKPDQDSALVPYPLKEDIIASGKGERFIIKESTPSPILTPPSVPKIPSSREIQPVRPISTTVAKSYSGYIEKLDQPVLINDREYGYELFKKRFDSRPVAFLTGDTIDLKKYLSRKVRLWAIVIKKDNDHPALMEVKGVGFLW